MRQFCSSLIGLASVWLTLSHGNAAEPLVDWQQRPQAWQRRDEPILSSHTTEQAWCQVVCYSPHVIHHDGKFRMWYLGTSIASRTNAMAMGYAESSDGIQWTEHPDNPILSGKDIPWGKTVQTPYVLWDEQDQIYKLWFVSGDGIRRDARNQITQNDQQLGYATSHDGIQWDIHPSPIFPSGRSPAVIKENDHSYRMWMGSRPDTSDRVSASLYTHIYAFKSTDGIQWEREPKPAIQPDGSATTSVYPFVLKSESGYTMWYGCHLPGRKFEIFCATSEDGTQWKKNHERAAFGAAAEKDRFDSRYTSTPCIVHAGDRYFLYYSARDLETEYRDGQGKLQRDGAGVYAHIGVATIP